MYGFVRSFVVGFCIVFAIGSMVGCSSTSGGVSGGKIVLEDEYHPLSRDEIIIGIQECESSGTRPVLQKARVKMAGRSADVVIGVTCSPIFTNTSSSNFERGYRTGYDHSFDRYNDRSRYK